MCLGSAFAVKLDGEKSGELVGYLSDFISVGDNENIAFGNVLKSCMLLNLKYICTYFFLSLTVYSAWLCPFVPGYRGFASGFTCTFIIKNYGFKGALYSLLSVIPSITLMFPVYVFTAVVCINFAAGRRKKGEAGIRSAAGIVPALAVIYCIMTVTSLFDAFISPVIFKYIF